MGGVTPRRPHQRVVSVALVLCVGLLAAACGSSSSGAAGNSSGSDDISTPLNGKDPAGLAGAVAQSPATPKPNFTLPDTSGQPFDFQTQTQGKLTLLYFGYTHCPDVCPATMAELGEGYKALPAADRAKIDVVFVTTDPDRDTGPVLRTWLNSFSPDFTGLVGTVGQTNAVLTSMGLPAIVHESTKDGGYAVDHIAIVFAFTSDGKAHVEFTDGVAPDRITHDLKLLVGGWRKGL